MTFSVVCYKTKIGQLSLCHTNIIVENAVWFFTNWPHQQPQQID